MGMRILKRSSGLAAVAALLLTAVPALADNQLDLSTVSSTGSPEPIRTGFYAETSLGTFFTLGGGDSYSNVEAFLGIGVGYDIIKELSVSVQFQLAPSAGDCYVVNSAGADQCPTSGSSTFTMLAIDAEISYRLQVANRVFIPFRAFGGFADFTPVPSNALAPVTNSDVWAPTFGLATGIEYATHFDHFTIGLEASGRFVLALNMTAIAIYPRIKYTF
jgi:hypothetical protein